MDARDILPNNGFCDWSYDGEVWKYSDDSQKEHVLTAGAIIPNGDGQICFYADESGNIKAGTLDYIRKNSSYRLVRKAKSDVIWFSFSPPLDNGSTSIMIELEDEDHGMKPMLRAMLVSTGLSVSPRTQIVPLRCSWLSQMVEQWGEMEASL